MMMKITNYINRVSYLTNNRLDLDFIRAYSVDTETKNLTFVPNLDTFFNQWFVGFSDGESSFNIVPKQDSKGIINRFTFMFVIGLHMDDIGALNYIQSQLNIGVVRTTKDECKFVVTKKEEIEILLNIFDKYNLNTTKYLDYLSFKKAFQLYFSRESLISEELKTQILELKNGMNSKRTDFNMPDSHTILITKGWLLGLIEGEGSFQLWRSDFIAAFSLVLTERQLPVLEKIKEFLIDNLGFDTYSTFKLNTSSVISLNPQKARKNSKGSVLLLIKNIYILNNFLVPYLNDVQFITKKGRDFKDFRLICALLNSGAHKDENIKSLILKLSYTMNNFRLSTNKELVENLSDSELNILVNAPALIEHLNDGRQRDLATGKIIHQHSSNIYEVIKPNNEVILKQTLMEVAEIVGVNIKTLSKHLDGIDEVDNTVEIKNNLIKRIAVFYKSKM